MISREEVKHIAKLARLGLTEKEIEKMRKGLSSIFNYFNKLKEVDVSKVKRTSHTILVENILREDQVKKFSPETADKLIKAAPDKKGRHIKVKAVL